MNCSVEESLESIADELYKLNSTIQFCAIAFSEIMGKPLNDLDEDGFSFTGVRK